jgi:hypothetical protein
MPVQLHHVCFCLGVHPGLSDQSRKAVPVKSCLKPGLPINHGTTAEERCAIRRSPIVLRQP